MIQICWRFLLEDFSVCHMGAEYEELLVKVGLGMSLATPFIAGNGRSPADSILRKERVSKRKEKESEKRKGRSESLGGGYQRPEVRV